MNLGNAIRICRAGKGMSQIKLAELVGITGSYLSLLEANKRNISFGTLKIIAEVLQIPLSILIFFAEEDKEELYAMDRELIDRISFVALLLIQRPLVDKEV